MTFPGSRHYSFSSFEIEMLMMYNKISAFWDWLDIDIIFNPLVIFSYNFWLNLRDRFFFKQNSWDELSYKFWLNPWGSFCFALIYQRWSPRGYILKSLALASKVKSLALASRPQVLENWPVLGPRTALFFELLKFCEALEKFFGKRFFVEIAWKFLWRPFFF